MKHNPRSKANRKKAKAILRLPDLEFARTVVLNSLSSPDAQRGYRHAIDEFVDWYCSEPRLAFNRIVVLKYLNYLEARQLASGTIKLRLGAVRRPAYEAADSGLLSSDLAFDIFQSHAKNAMLAMLFALTGGIFLVKAMGLNFSVAVWVGFIALFGTAVQTGVVIVIYLEEGVAGRKALDGRLTRAGLHAAVIE